MPPLTKSLINLAKKRLYYKQNPIAFIEECVKIPSVGGSEFVKLYEPQKRIIRSFFKDHNLILLKTRQVGMSTLTQIIITYIFTFYENCVVGIISRDGAESTDFCRKVQYMIDELPDDIRPEYKNKVVQYFVLKNGCQLHTSAVSAANPGAVFRSKTITFLVIDEAAHVRYIDEAWTGIASTLSKSHKVAARRRVPYGTIILSTPNRTQGIGKWFFEMWRDSNSGAAIDNGDNTITGFVPHTIHWKEIPDFANDPEWYEEQCRKLRTPAKIAQELEMKFIDADNALFDENIQMKLQSCVSAKHNPKQVPIPNLAPGKGELWKFREPNRIHLHLIGVDCAGQTGQDKCAIEVIEYETMNQVLEFHGKLDPKEFVDVLRYVCALVPNNYIIVDATGGYGQTVCYDLLYDNSYHYNLFGEYKNSGLATPFEPGLKITSRNRSLIIEALFHYVSEDPELILSPRLSMELLTLVEIKSGKVVADVNSHDDLALAYAYCCYIRKYKAELVRDLIDANADVELDDIDRATYDMLHGFNSPDAPLLREFQFGSAEIDGSTPGNARKIDGENAKILDRIIHGLDMGEMGGTINVLELMGIDTSIYGHRIGF